MARKKSTKVSPVQWERFQRHVVYWQVLLGLQDWGITCMLAKAELCAEAAAEMHDNESATTIAWVEDDYGHHLATVYLRGDVFAEGVSQEEVDKAAFHEVCHILLTPLEHYALQGGADETVRQEVHRLIRVLENTFYENQKKELVNGES